MQQKKVHVFVRRLRSDRFLYLAIGLYLLISVLCLAGTRQWQEASYGVYFIPWTNAFLVVMPLLAIAIDICMICLRFPRRRSLAYKRVFSADRIHAFAAGLLLLAAMMIFQGAFTSMKNLLPDFGGGFVDDVVQADIDHWLHFGLDPWRYLYAVAKAEWVLHVVEWSYNVLWFVICFGALFFVATSPKADGIRLRYFLMYMFVWVGLGNVVAGLFLSAGPAFYGFVTGDMGRFAEQLRFLATSTDADSASAYQAYLWQIHVADRAGIGGGISAFPSVHVALIMMNAMFVNEYSRTLGRIAFAYTAFIMMSSVYLAWHYAIDGYVSVALVFLGHHALHFSMSERSACGTAMQVIKPQVA
ncbi:phosphatase PAP2 family protein [Rhizobium oryzicola]|uniref:Phosphatase PAP2 family protein n=1 Tax=Rhizobium oryzicola TaxID=1232668 RepID=A0ABT8SVD8_9HYPH|nr:phosphatase PAP2 family protein [Rhizobium oryzicola]MDO1582372.1 phosphatase PAP2 family protein [Rhizobium oryzicola]